MDTVRGVLRYGWLNANRRTESANFVLFPPNQPGLKVLTQDGKPFNPGDLVTYNNLQVELKGTKDSDAFRVIAISKVS